MCSWFGSPLPQPGFGVGDRALGRRVRRAGRRRRGRRLRRARRRRARCGRRTVQVPGSGSEQGSASGSPAGPVTGSESALESASAPAWAQVSAWGSASGWASASASAVGFGAGFGAAAGVSGCARESARPPGRTHAAVSPASTPVQSRDSRPPADGGPRRRRSRFRDAARRRQVGQEDHVRLGRLGERLGRQDAADPSRVVQRAAPEVAGGRGDGHEARDTEGGPGESHRGREYSLFAGCSPAETVEGWRTGLEPATTGTTTRGSTN